MAQLAADHWEQGDLDIVIRNMQEHKEEAWVIIAKATGKVAS